MSKSLPARPNLNWLKNRAKDQLDELRAKNPAAKLAQAQLALARDYGFTSWRALKAEVDRVINSPEELPEKSLLDQFRDAINTGELPKTKSLLRSHAIVPQNINPPPFPFAPPAIIPAAKNPELVDVLLQFGADINKKSAWWA